MRTTRRTLGVRTLALVVALSGAWPAAAQQHPLDPLSWQEHWTVLEVLQADGKLNADTRFGSVSLKEPDKASVWTWRGGDSPSREALAIVKQEARTFEAVVDLRKRAVKTWREIAGAHVPLLEEELLGMGDVIKNHPEFKKALNRRGYADATFVDCFAVTLGYFGTPIEQGRRLAYGICEDPRGARNAVSRRIEGLMALIDLNRREVIKVIDDGIVPVSSARADFDQAALGPPRALPGPIALVQPQGPGFELQGNTVRWQKWSFHVRIDHRVGPVVSTVRYRDGDRDRRIMYRGSLSEIFVPYMDPATPWYAQNFLDAGEFALGGLTKPLDAGTDCPENAVYLDAIYAGDNGRPKPRPRVACVYERYAGDMSWRHHDEGTATTESRRKRDLVVRAIATLGNYDYVFDWVFQQDGTIRIAAGATGMAQVKAVARRSTTSSENGNGNGSPAVRSPQTSAPDAYGRLVDQDLVAVNHDHYMNFRLDLDVDGEENALAIDRLKMVELPKDHPRRSIWVTEPSIARNEAEGQANVDMHRPGLWRVINTAVKNHVGYPVSFHITPGMTAMPLFTANDFPLRRAGFIQNNLWVTPYHPDELYAAGMYPTLSRPGEGLPKWTSANRPIQNTDIVVWYTMGMHHVVRAEDWPVMPVSWNYVEIRPFDFFDRNPALDVPRGK